MNIKYSLDTTGYRFYPFTTDLFRMKYDQVQKCKPGKTYVLDTDNIQTATGLRVYHILS